MLNYKHGNILKAIKENNEKPFFKVKIIEENEKYNYLCLGVEKQKLLVIKNNKLSTISLSKKKKQEIIILEDNTNTLQEKLDKAMM